MRFHIVKHLPVPFRYQLSVKLCRVEYENFYA